MRLVRLRGLFDQLDKSSDEPDCPSPVDTAEEFGMTVSVVRQASYRLRQRYRQVLREEVAHTVMLPGDIDDGGAPPNRCVAGVKVNHECTRINTNDFAANPF